MTEQTDFSDVKGRVMERPGSEDWPERTFSEVIEINNYPSLKKGEEHTYVGMRDIDVYERKIKGSEKKEYKYSAPRFRNEDTLFPKMSRCLENGKTAFVDILNEDEIAFGSTEFVVMSPTKDVIPKFIYYTVRRPDIVEQALKWRNGTTARRQRISTDVFDEITIKIPSLEEQKRIVTVLDSLDSKIELNERINNRFEQTAHVLFKSWFVDFEPFGSLKTSSLGEIPEEFEVVTIDDVAKVQKGLSYSSDYWDEDGYALINLNNVQEGGGFDKDGIKFYSGPHKSKHEISSGDLVITLTEQTLDGELIGSPALVPPLSEADKTVISTDLASITPRKDAYVSREYLYHLMFHDRFRKYSESHATGTTVYHYSPDSVRDFSFPLPPKEDVEKFTSVVSPFYKHQFNSSLQNTHLKNIRDLLLPKLLSGEVHVQDLELEQLPATRGE